jgi:hypothetical protein
MDAGDRPQDDHLTPRHDASWLEFGAILGEATDASYKTVEAAL